MDKRNKQLGNLSLAAMATGFIATLPVTGTYTGALLQAGFEAGVVGGLADWFAVTALFRHPLGLPIPHTALLPKNRERVSKALISTVENDLLSKEMIVQKIGELNVTDYVMDMSAKELHSDSVRQGLQLLARELILQIPLEQTAALLQKEAKTYIRSLNTSAVLQFLVEQAQARGLEEKAFNVVLVKAAEYAARPETRDKIGEMAMEALKKLEAGGLMSFAINAFIGFMTEEKLGDIAQNFILTNLVELSHADNPTRLNLLGVIRDELSGISTNEKLLEAVESWKTRELEELDFSSRLTDILTQYRQKLLDYVGNGSFAEGMLLPFLEGALGRIRNDADMYGKLQTWINGKLIQLVEENHSRIGKLIKENLDKLDNETLTEMIEDKVGKDLQWIRVNGALCGFLIGLVLGGIKLLLA